MCKTKIGKEYTQITRDWIEGYIDGISKMGGIDLKDKVMSCKQDEVYQCVLCGLGFEGNSLEMRDHVDCHHPGWANYWERNKANWLKGDYPKPPKHRTLVVVDRDKLAKQIKALCHLVPSPLYELDACYRVISACELEEPEPKQQLGYGQVYLDGGWVGCEWIDSECFVNPKRCSLATAGICQVYTLHGKGKHGQVKSGEHASG